MEKRRRMPIGVQEFSKMIEDEYVYVDKTEHIYNLVDRGYVYFLSRPRRFGKSLLVSTLHEYFSGNKELFKGLYIYEKVKEWNAHPVFHFDFSGATYDGENSLKNKLICTLAPYEKEYGCPGDNEDLALRFQMLLQAAYEKTGLGCVVLVDEYDKCLLETFENPELNMKYRNTFKSFFGVIKGSSKFIKFAFFTGITKLRNVSIFSDLNNLEDISLDEEYSDICGITQAELEKYFSPEIEAMALEKGISKADCIMLLKTMYDGYHFSQDLKDVYNPFSLLNALKKKNPTSYWFSQSTPTFLIDRLKKGNWSLVDYDEGKKIDVDSLGEIEQSPRDPTPLLYQSGYLTIKSYNEEDEAFILSYPNKEIRKGFVKFIVPTYLNIEQDSMSAKIFDIKSALQTCDLETLFNCLKAIYATLPYYEGNDNKFIERDFANVLSIVFILVGEYVTREAHFSRGRSDCILQTGDYVYIFEFKRDKTAKEALAQINAKGYADAFKADKRKLVKLGVNFSSDLRNINEWEVGEGTAVESPTTVVE